MKKLIQLICIAFVTICSALPVTTVMTPVAPRVAQSASSVQSANSVDDFTRVNANPISNPMSDTVGIWTTTSQGGLGTVQITANTAAPSGAGDSGTTVVSPSYGANQFDSITVPSAGVGGATYIGPRVRCQSASGNSYVAYTSGSATIINVAKIVDTGTLAFTTLGASFTVSSLVQNDVIRLEVSGTTLTLLINGVSQGTRTDGTYSTGQPGWYSGGGPISTNRCGNVP